MRTARRTYYIKKDFQKRFILEYISLVILGIILVNGILYLLLDKEIDGNFYRAHISISTTADVVRSPLALAALIIVSLSVAAATIFTYLNTWRVGIRLHALSVGLKNLRDGDLTAEIRMDKGEHMKELSDTFNKAARYWNKKISSIKADISDMERAASGVWTDREYTIDTMLKKVGSAERELQSFKLR